MRALPPLTRARVPLRVDLAGSWTDVPAFASRHGGCVVGLALALHASVECRPGGGTMRLVDAGVGAREVVQRAESLVPDGALARHKAALAMLPITGGVELTLSVSVPWGAALGEGAAANLALLAALARARGDGWDADDLAAFATDLEREALGRPVGDADAVFSRQGGVLAVRTDGAATTVERLVEPEAVRELGAVLVLGFVAPSHFRQQVWSRVWDGVLGDQVGMTDTLLESRAAADDAAAALRAADWPGLGRAVQRAGDAVWRLDPAIAGDRVPRLAAAVRSAGAWGARAAGFGAGGTLVAVAPPSARDAVLTALRGAGARVLASGIDWDGLVVSEEAQA